jgi:hypothetical protein
MQCIILYNLLYEFLFVLFVFVGNITTYLGKLAEMARNIMDFVYMY